jgi:hypothetical protein
MIYLADISSKGVCAVLAAFSITDMILYNRKRRNQWVRDKHKVQEEDLLDAFNSYRAGTADEEQLELLETFRKKEIAKQLSASRTGILTKVKSWFVDGYTLEEKKGGALASSLAAQSSVPEANLGGSVQERGEGLGIVEAIEEKRAQKAQHESVVHTSQKRGMLDHLADNAVKDISKGWSGWILGK